MHLCNDKPDNRSQTEALVAAITSVLQSNVSRLVDSCCYYIKSQALSSCSSNFESFVRFQSATNAFCVPKEITLSDFVSKVSLNGNPSPYLVGRRLDPFSRRSCTNEGAAALETTLDEYSVIYNQLKCLQSWHKFIFAFTKVLRTNENFKPYWNESELFGSMFSALLRAITIGEDESAVATSKLSLERVLRIDALVGQILLIAKYDFGANFSQLHQGIRAIAFTIDSMLILRLDSQEVSQSVTSGNCLKAATDVEHIGPRLCLCFNSSAEDFFALSGA
jgi:hypothetical protein